MMHARHMGPMHGGRLGLRLRDGAGHGALIDHLLAAGDEIKLTDAQRDKLRQIRRNAPGALMPKKQAVVEARMDLRDLLESDKADAAGLRRAHDKVLKARSDLAAAAFDLHVQARDVLTAEQRQKLHDGVRQRVRGQIRERMRGHGGSGFFDDDADEGEGDDDGIEF
jgi:Spy/CpxP family protein refolding chaperone